ncbi:hypothetical protein LB507_003207, partial [Fusarium sp. FIESC RH6]
SVKSTSKSKNQEPKWKEVYGRGGLYEDGLRYLPFLRGGTSSRRRSSLSELGLLFGALMACTGLTAPVRYRSNFLPFCTPCPFLPGTRARAFLQGPPREPVAGSQDQAGPRPGLPLQVQAEFTHVKLQRSPGGLLILPSPRGASPGNSIQLSSSLGSQHLITVIGFHPSYGTVRRSNTVFQFLGPWHSGMDGRELYRRHDRFRDNVRGIRELGLPLPAKPGSLATLISALGGDQ